MSKFFSEWRTLRDNVALSAAFQKLVITRYYSSYKNNILAVPQARRQRGGGAMGANAPPPFPRAEKVRLDRAIGRQR